jgi:hypothetical protein
MAGKLQQMAARAERLDHVRFGVGSGRCGKDLPSPEGEGLLFPYVRNWS